MKKHLYFYVYLTVLILYALEGKSTLPSTQEFDQNKERKIINIHIMFINECNQYIQTVEKSIHRLNKQLQINSQHLNQGYPISLNKIFEEEKINNYSGDFAIDKTYLIKKYSSINKLKNSLSQRHTSTLFFKSFEDVFIKTIHLANLFEQISTFYENKKYINSLSQIETINKLIDQSTILIGQLVESNYTFSLSSVINFRKETLPPPLSSLKHAIAQVKNIIMAIHQKNKSLSKNYLVALEKAIEQLQYSENEWKTLEAIGDYKGNEKKTMYNNIKKQLKYIYAEAEKHLQNPISNNNTGINKLIRYFNKQKKQTGIADLYNRFIKYADMPILMYVEEPISFTIKNPIISKSSPTYSTDTFYVKQKTTDSISANTSKTHVALSEYKAPPQNLLFLIDVSASMQKEDGLPLLKNAIIEYIHQMKEKDRISIVIYAAKAILLLTPSLKKDTSKIIHALQYLKAGGGTQAENGIYMAYNTLKKHYIPQGKNHIILATDGIFTLNEHMKQTITKYASDTTHKISISSFEFGHPEKQEYSNLLKRIAHLGKGHFFHISNKKEAIDNLILDAQ